MGFLLAVCVHAAHISETRGSHIILLRLHRYFTSGFKKTFVDGGYKKGCIDWCFLMFRWVIEVVKRSDCAKGFQVLPKRWIVERTFGWLSNYRRMNRDYEHNPKSSENNIKFIMVQIMLKRIVQSP